LEILPILPVFRPYHGIIPRAIIVNTNTGYSWMVKLKNVNGTTAMDQGWPRFSIAHNMKISYFITFKVHKGDVFKVTMSNYIIAEVVKWCAQHDPSLAMIDE
jgi:hypothetical protein